MRRTPSKNSHLGTTPESQNCRVVAPSGPLLWSSVCWAMGCSQKPGRAVARTDPSQSHSPSTRKFRDGWPVGSHTLMPVTLEHEKLETCSHCTHMHLNLRRKYGSSIAMCKSPSFPHLTFSRLPFLGPECSQSHTKE